MRKRIFYCALPGPKSKADAQPVTAFPEAVCLDTAAAEDVQQRLLTRVILPSRWAVGDTVTAADGSQFEHSDFLYADLDDGRLTLKDFEAKLSGIDYLIYTSTNHQKEKNGVVCDRYKVLFPLQKRVYDLGLFQRLLKRLVAALGSDPNGSLPKQKYFPPYCSGPFFAHHHGAGDILSWLKAQGKPAVGRGERNAWLYREACKLAIAGHDEAAVLELLKEARDTRVEDPDDLELADAALASMARRACAKFSGSDYCAVYQGYEKRFVKVHDPLGVFDLAEARLKPLENSKRFYENVPHNFVTLDDGKTLNVWQVWLKLSPRCAESIEFEPAVAPLGIRVTDRRGHAVTALNTFTGMVSPSAAGSCDLYLAFVKDVVCSGDESIYNWLYNYLAYIYQHPSDPERKHCYAISLSGKQGTGKNTFVELYGRIFGECFTEINDVEAVLGFNSELSSKLVVLFDEAFSASWKNVKRVLKSLITSRWLTINEKFVAKYRLRNHCRYFFATNDEHSAPVEPGDRRYVCLELSAAHKEDLPYFEKIWAEASNGGTQHLAYMLGTHPVDEALLARRPKTDKWRANIDESLSERGAVYAFLKDLTEADDLIMQDVGTGFWAMLEENQGYVSRRLLLDEINRFARSSGLPAVTINRLSRTLVKYIPSAVQGASHRHGASGSSERAYFLGSREQVEKQLKEVLA